PTLKTSLSVFTARVTVVFSIGWKLGSPWNATSGACTSVRFTRAVCGICAISTASAACEVPGTDASTRERLCSSGIFLKSAGSVGVAKVHGPVKSGAENQRPATREYTRPVVPAQNTSLRGFRTPRKAGARHRDVARLAGEQDQLGGLEADEYLGHGG